MLSVVSRLRINTKPADNLGSPARVIFNTLAIFFLTQFIAAFIVISASSLVKPGQAASTVLDYSIFAQFCYVLAAELLAVWIVIRLLRRRVLAPSFIGLGRKPAWKDVSRALAGFLGFYALMVITSLALTFFFPDFKTNQQQNLGFNNLASPSDSVLAVIALVIFPPIGEEILVRGYLYSGLRATMRYIPALLATSFIFGLAHLEIGNGGPLVWGAAIQTFILSVVLVHLRQKSGALYAGILVHMLNNAIAYSVHFHG